MEGLGAGQLDRRCVAAVLFGVGVLSLLSTCTIQPVWLFIAWLKLIKCFNRHQEGTSRCAGAEQQGSSTCEGTHALLCSSLHSCACTISAVCMHGECLATVTFLKLLAYRSSFQRTYMMQHEQVATTGLFQEATFQVCQLVGAVELPGSCCEFKTGVFEYVVSPIQE